VGDVAGEGSANIVSGRALLVSLAAEGLSRNFYKDGELAEILRGQLPDGYEIGCAEGALRLVGGRWNRPASLTEVTPRQPVDPPRGMDGCCLLMHGRDSASYPCFLLTQACDGSRVIHAVALVVNEGDLENEAHLNRLREQVRALFTQWDLTRQPRTTPAAIPETDPPSGLSL
jgi:hypothetical protein